jgi:hypothetical protein
MPFEGTSMLAHHRAEVDCTQENAMAEANTGSGQGQGTKILGAVAAIVVLAGLLLWGASQSQTEAAELITDTEKPAEAAYQDEADPLEYEPARLGDYEMGKKLVFEAKVVSIVNDAEVGEQNAIANFVTEAQTNADTVKQERILLVFADGIPVDNLEQNDTVEVSARYIGSGEFETPVGGTKEAPAFQVDYLEPTG